MVIEEGISPFTPADIILEREYDLCEAYDKKFRAGIGAEGVQALLEQIDLDQLGAALREEVSESTGQKKRKLIKRLQVAEDFRKSKSAAKVHDPRSAAGHPARPAPHGAARRRPVCHVGPQRPVPQGHQPEQPAEEAPGAQGSEIIIRNEKRMLQEAVDALIDNGRMGRPSWGQETGPSRASRTCSGARRDGSGSLLGKRVDYSGRSVIVIGPSSRSTSAAFPSRWPWSSSSPSSSASSWSGACPQRKERQADHRAGPGRDLGHPRGDHQGPPGSC